MKNFKVLLLAVAASWALTSCTDDDAGNNVNVSGDLTGTFSLTSLVAPSSQDFDEDGDSNTNLVLEGECYNRSWISFKGDGTYQENFRSTVMGTGGLSLSCDTEVSSGTYTKNGNTVVTTDADTDVETTFNFDSSAKTLTRADNNGSFVGWDMVGNIWAELTGSLQLTYTKYTDNENDNGENIDIIDNINVDAVVLGSFDLTSYIVATAQDLDGDGDASTNLMTESSCYADTRITFNSDGTYNKTTAMNVASASGLTLNCETETTTGTWTRNGNSVTTTQSGSSAITADYTLDAANETLMLMEEDASYMGFNSVTSFFANLTGDVTYTFTKESN